ncbi:MAG: hypothetical protein QOH97_2280 [Actinoplanes sp.]|jgi:hypothetical protein|nr:hypothetical protein [Actinoplanes sp.]
MAIQDFRPIGEVVADDRRRIPFGKAGVHDGDKFAVAVNDEGQILLTPLATIPKRELIIWENAELRASLFRGIADVAEGHTSRLDLDELDVDNE